MNASSSPHSKQHYHPEAATAVMASVAKAETVLITAPPKQQQEPFLMIGSIPIYFEEDWTTGIGGGLWSTGLAMALYLQDHSDAILTSLQRLYEQNHRHPLSLLELGSGHGLLSLCWLAVMVSYDKQQHWMKHLVITDTQEHLPLIQRTLSANSHLTGSVSSPVRITVMDHEWGVFHRPADERNGTSLDDIPNDHEDHDNHCCEHDHHLYSDKQLESLVRQGRYQFDLIFGSDLAYRRDLYQPLLRSLQVFSKSQVPPPATCIPTTHHHDRIVTVEQTPTSTSISAITNTCTTITAGASNSIILMGCTMNDTTPDFFDQARTAGFCYERLADYVLRPEFRNGNHFGIFCFQRQKLLS